MRLHQVIANETKEHLVTKRLYVTKRRYPSLASGCLLVRGGAKGSNLVLFQRLQEAVACHGHGPPGRSRESATAPSPVGKPI